MILGLVVDGAEPAAATRRAVSVDTKRQKTFSARIT